MLLSDAILLGSTMIHPRASMLYDRHSNSGCALGMSLVAVNGLDMTNPWNVQAHWPWICSLQANYPCTCLGINALSSVDSIIVHLFDLHVMRESQEARWSLEQLVEWVRKIEPKEVAANGVLEQKPAVDTEQLVASSL